MKPRPIGYYVHHHGAGHRARADAIAKHIDCRLVLIGTGIGAAGLDLPDDRPLSGHFHGRDNAPCRPSALHYAPLDHDGVRERVAVVASWIASERPALMVVDVSVEIAMLARLASVPTVYVRLNGERNDSAHLEAFRGATGILAPFHSGLESEATPAWVRAKSHYFPGITATAAMKAPAVRRVLVVFGRGGLPGDGALVAVAASSCPDWQWRVIGPATETASIPENLTFAGWVSSPECEIARATVIVGAAGDGLIGAVMGADRPFLCIPENRPFAEQQVTAEGLRSLGAAIVVPGWPSGKQWPALLERTLALPPWGRRTLQDADGARKAAAWLAAQAFQASICPEHAP
ncbi:glycosyltransferase [Novosphingobium barchaimii LL02]|uniref:Glycosyltransferase n=1 Tax=Novosphingobium barchaimii LL02 TaxID=1114963 RepID=A0A0J7XYL2_9SPHN|nr:glycosyltransferase [Novosphingobium barchaimii]KMS56572.1 glycosyltransferase [Novosphingobium barchaimii LL02]